MRRIGTACLLLVIGALVAVAAELPSRKPGLWEIRMTMENRSFSQALQQCVDASTDQMLQSSAGPFSVEVCPKHDIQRSDDKTTIDSTCTVDGKTATVRAVITGSFDSAYSMTVMSQGAAVPAGAANMTIVAKWLGPCTKDQKPGDVIMPGGRKFNVPELRSRAPSPIEPGALPPR